MKAALVWTELETVRQAASYRSEAVVVELAVVVVLVALVGVEQALIINLRAAEIAPVYIVHGPHAWMGIVRKRN